MWIPLLWCPCGLGLACPLFTGCPHRDAMNVYVYEVFHKKLCVEMARQQDGTDSHACAEFRLVTWPLKCSWPTLNSSHVGEISSLWKCPVLSFTWQGILGLCPPAARLPPLTKGILGIFCSYMARKKVWVFFIIWREGEVFCWATWSTCLCFVVVWFSLGVHTQCL